MRTSCNISKKSNSSLYSTYLRSGLGVHVVLEPVFLQQLGLGDEMVELYELAGHQVVLAGSIEYR